MLLRVISWIVLSLSAACHETNCDFMNFEDDIAHLIDFYFFDETVSKPDGAEGNFRAAPST